MKVSSIGMRMLFATSILVALLGGCDRRTAGTDQPANAGSTAPGSSAATGSSAPGTSATPPASPAPSGK